MSAFKIGDRVRALDNGQRQIPIGAIGTVTDVAYPNNPNPLYGINGVKAGFSGNWAKHFELVTDDIKVGDYVSINKSAYLDGVQNTGTVKSIETYATVKSDSGQDYVRKLDELTPAVRPDPIPAEPAHNTAFKFDGSRLTWVWDETGWSFLDPWGNKSHKMESWASLCGRYVGRNNGRKGFTVL